MNKKLRIVLIVLAALMAAWIGLKMMTKIPEVKTFAMEERDRLPVGRTSIGVFEEYKVTGSTSRYDGLTLRGDDAMSEPSFMAWVDRRWNEIQQADAKQDAEHRPKMYRPSPYEVGFKFNALDISDSSVLEWVYDGEGGVWLDNKAVFIAPGGAPNADRKITKIIDHVREMESKADKGYCLEFYCLDLPVSDNESAGLNIQIPKYGRLRVSVDVDTYTSSQNEYFSQRTPSGGIRLSPQLLKTIGLGGSTYSNAEKRTVDGIVGEQDIFGRADGINGHYETSIQARWYHPGTSKDPNDPSIEIVLIYEFKTDHKPSKMGWFDNATVKETGLTAEKFMSMWEATLKSFKRHQLN